MPTASTITAGICDSRNGGQGSVCNREAERRVCFGAEGQSPLIDVFNRRFRACSTVESAAELIASAWMDERSGITGSLSALHDWFTDVRRFSGDWIANVNELLVELDRIHT